MKIQTLVVSLTALALAGACQETEAPETEAPVPVPEEQPAALEVNIIDCGTLEFTDLDSFSTAGDYAGVADTMTVPCFLVRHSDGILLWDLGNPGILAEIGPQTQYGTTASLDTTLTQQIEDLGLTMSDIDYVSISHSHVDHIGQIDQISGATWLVHENELAAMFPPETAQDEASGQEGRAAEMSAIQRSLYEFFSSLDRKTFTGEYDVFGDGSVVIFEMPGHTPGHTSLQLMMPESGPVLLTGDLYHRKESRELKRVPVFNTDEAQTLVSIDSFEARADRLGAKVVIQHEPADIEPLGGVIH